MQRFSLKRRPLGDTGLLVTPIGLGLAALGRPGYINLGHGTDLRGKRSVEALEQLARQVLDSAWDSGLRYFDAARSYGLGERFLGRWLTARAIDPVVGSKWGYTYTADWRVDAVAHEIKDHGLAVLRRQWVESNELLGSNLDLYQIHSATVQSGVLDDAEVLAELARIKARGVRVGLTTSGPDQARTIEHALEIRIDGIRLFDTVQATWNLLETSAGTALSSASQAGLGVIIKEALANGRLTARNQAPQFNDTRRELDALAHQNATTIDALALAAVLTQPWVDVALSGAASVEQLESNLGALGLEQAWSGQDTGAFSESAEFYWRTRSSLRWN